MKPLRNDLVLRAARGERTERTPVWLMRQAGRVDPAYRALRERANIPLETMFRTVDLCVEASLLPRRFGVDAIILFQDILTPLAPMGAPFVFRPGPVLAEPTKDPLALGESARFDPSIELGFVGDSIRKVKQALSAEMPLLGFAGAPFTLAMFLMERGSPGVDAPRTRAVMANDPKAFHRLLTKLADMTANYLVFQIEAGVDAVQLFESLSDRLTPDEYDEFAHPYQVQVFSQLQRRVPTILFAKQQPRVEKMAASGADVLSVGTCVDLAEARLLTHGRVAFQGNVDNSLLQSGTPEQVEQAVRRCMKAGQLEGHILNLSHGILPDTPFENVVRMIEVCKECAVSVDPVCAAEEL